MFKTKTFIFVLEAPRDQDPGLETRGLHHWPKLSLDRCVFSCCRKEVKDETVRMTGGRLFHARDAATGKARSPWVNRCTDGTTSVMVVEERRWRRPFTSAVRRTLSARYSGADPLRHRNARTQRRNWIRSGTRNQWRSRRSGVMRSERLAENTSRAAALRIDCSLSSRWPETPASTEQQ